MLDPIQSHLLQALREQEKAGVEAIGKSKLHGQELYIPTRAGTSRVLLYRPDLTEIAVPVYFHIHGGGFISGTIESWDPLCHKFCQELGIAVVNIEYRLAPEAPYPGGLEDVYDVIQYISRRAQEFGVLPERMAVGGDSAGANLSAAVSLMVADSGEFSLVCQILMYPITDFTLSPQQRYFTEGCITPEYQQLVYDAYCPEISRRKEPYCSPGCAAEKQLRSQPTTLVLTAEIDGLRDEAEEYAHRLVRAGVEVTIRRFLGFFHGFVFVSEEAQQLILRTLRRCLVEKDLS